MFDPTSIQYQISKQYVPNKESTWPYPAQEDGWFHAHNALRGQMQMIHDALQTIQSRHQPLLDWEVKALVQAFDHHYEFIHTHHSNEDDISTPELLKRFQYPEKVCVYSYCLPYTNHSNIGVFSPFLLFVVTCLCSG
jgi:hypothetical protein